MTGKTGITTPRRRLVKNDARTLNVIHRLHLSKSELSYGMCVAGKPLPYLILTFHTFFDTSFSRLVADLSTLFFISDKQQVCHNRQQARYEKPPKTFPITPSANYLLPPIILSDIKKEQRITVSTSPLLDRLSGQSSDRVPVWLYRQAGRYLPEYRQLRNRVNGFLDLCLTPQLAADVTLQPVRRFGLDAAILFADILLVPYALGRTPEFRAGEKPALDPVRQDRDLLSLRWDIDKLSPVFETLTLVKAALPGATALIGFAGGPWTIAAYMLDGGSAAGFSTALSMVHRDPAFVERLLSLVQTATTDYLERQIKAGADVLQLFDSWAGLLSGSAFHHFVIEPTRFLVSALKRKYPKVSVIGFPRGAIPDDYQRYLAETGVDALALDQNISLAFARTVRQSQKPLQGNLDPWLLVEGGDRMRIAAEKILAAFGSRHIMNLGHGVPPQTPPENVAELVRYVRAWTG
jgi:uroporphyrinogen decarboxylase